MKGKITGTLKPPLTNRHSELGYWKLNEMLESGECLRQKHQFLNLWSKTVSRTMVNEQSQNGRGEYQIDEMTYAKGGLLLMSTYVYNGEGVEKSVLRYVRTKWMVPHKFYGIFFVHWSCLKHHRHQEKCRCFLPS